ncbi:MAG: phosphatase PAP2 family protein [Streptosporangiaceae bacterium]
MAVVSCQARHGYLGWLDRAVMAALQKRQHPVGAVTAARAVSALAEPAVVSALLATGFLSRRPHADWAATAMTGVTIASGVAARRLLSVAIARPRPPVGGWLTKPEGFSLPSKHATLTGLAVGAWLRRSRPAGPAADLRSAAAVAAMGASRVYLGVHWPTDILAAWLYAEGWLRLAELIGVGARDGTSALAGTADAA